MAGMKRRVIDFVGRRRPLTVDEFVQQCPSHKRKIYDRAAEEYLRSGWARRDAKLKLFVKFEKINFTKKANPVPRLISPRGPVYNVALGRYTRAVEEEIYRACAEVWDEDEDTPVVMKGLTVEQIAFRLREKWDRYKNPVAVGIDASRFDQHVSVDALKFEHGVYNGIFRSRSLVRILKEQLRNRGVALLDGFRVDTVVDGTRASGDMNTGLGNCLIMCALVRLFCEEIGLKASLINNGDDCVLIFERSDLRKLFADGKITPTNYDWFLRFGFEMEFEDPVDVFEKVVFCQMQPVSTPTGWVMVRQLCVALGKDVVSLGCDDVGAYLKWAAQVGTGGSTLYGDMPIFNEFYKALSRMGGSATPSRTLISRDSGFARLCARGRNHDGVVADPTRVSFYRAFGIVPSHQVAIESYYAAWELGSPIVHNSVVPMGPVLGVVVPTG